MGIQFVNMSLYTQRSLDTRRKFPRTSKDEGIQIALKGIPVIGLNFLSEIGFFL